MKCDECMVECVNCGAKSYLSGCQTYAATRLTPAEWEWDDYVCENCGCQEFEEI